MWQTWIAVTPSADARYPLALRFRYDKATITALKQDFGGEAACLRWNAEERCWLLKRSQFDALCAGYGDRLEVAPEAWRLLFPAKQKRNGDAR